ncbi:MAG: hypothetical protein U5L75_01405 [Candidatus Campbellbacteria bacterium]|nr:hypothetical protein [Candidatus Campbellbacteria bacterium]
MGYSKNPGSFSDTLKMIPVLILLFEILIGVVVFLSGDLSDFVVLNKTLLAAITSVLFTWTFLVIVMLVLSLHFYLEGGK